MSTGRSNDWLARLRAIGPYVAVEMLLPGGTLIALLLWFVQRVAAVGGGSPSNVSPIREETAIAAKPHAPTPLSQACLSREERATGDVDASLCTYGAEPIAAAEGTGASADRGSHYPKCAWSLIVSACHFPWRSANTVSPVFEV